MVAEPTRRVMLVGLHVTDEERYRRYRAGMTPILHAYGGAFGYDFVIAEVLQSETPAPINRVFTIVFADPAQGDRFFADPAYLAVRAEWFAPAVASITRIADFEQPAPATAP